MMKNMIAKTNNADLHCHVLPGIDDGASDLGESLRILEDMEKQGIQHIVCTPHFYLNKTNVSRFIKKRKESYSLLAENYQGNISICLGAEVYYCHGIYNIENFEDLTMGNSEYILIELPYSAKIDVDVINDIEKLMQTTGLTVIMAHIERFLDKLTWRASRKLYSLNVIYQVNLSSVTNDKLVKPTLKFIKKGGYIILGTDTHNMKERSADCYLKGLDIIANNLGENTVERLISNTYNIYNEIAN